MIYESSSNLSNDIRRSGIWHALDGKPHKGLPAHRSKPPSAERERPWQTQREYRPWITHNGKPLCDSILKRRCKAWTPEIWESYLRWYQSPCKEALLRGRGYEIICGNRSETIYGEYGYEQDEFLQKYVEILLRRTTKKQESVLRLYYLEGQTELQVSRRLRIDPSCVHRRKKTALLKLSRKHSEENCSAIHIIRGLFTHSECETPSLWQKPAGTIRVDQIYAPPNWNAELQAIRCQALKQALSELIENQKRIVYLRLWCDQTDSQIARLMEIGVNSVQEISSAAVSKVKRRMAELTQNQEEVSS